MPGFCDDCVNPYCCDECVPRGCSCNHYYMSEEEPILPNLEEDGVEGVDWKWVDEEKTHWTHIDEKGREYPCCEWMHDPDGYEWD